MIDVVHAAEIVEQAVEATGPIGSLGINLSGFIAQLVNFAIVLFILWRWAYRPLLRVMEERTTKIEKSLADAHAIEKERMELEKTKAAEIKRAKEEAAALLHEAHDKAIKAAETIREKTKNDVEGIVQQAREQIVAERETMREELKQETLVLAAEIAQKVLGEKMNSAKDEKLLREALGQKGVGTR